MRSIQWPQTKQKLGLANRPKRVTAYIGALGPMQGTADDHAARRTPKRYHPMD
jgi:hypothetical protein